MLGADIIEVIPARVRVQQSLHAQQTVFPVVTEEDLGKLAALLK